MKRGGSVPANGRARTTRAGSSSSGVGGGGGGGEGADLQLCTVEPLVAFLQLGLAVHLLRENGHLIVVHGQSVTKMM
jgi:hypothetical protein